MNKKTFGKLLLITFAVALSISSLLLRRHVVILKQNLLECDPSAYRIQALTTNRFRWVSPAGEISAMEFQDLQSVYFSIAARINYLCHRDANWVDLTNVFPKIP